MIGLSLGLPAAIRDEHTPSARLVYLALREAGVGVSYSELAAATGVDQVTIRRELLSLREAGHVEPAEHPTDGRRRLWRVAPEPGADVDGADGPDDDGEPDRELEARAGAGAGAESDDDRADGGDDASADGTTDTTEEAQEAEK
jgi:DNA-binding transcriptional ArsR family regulator